jgi:hypothetical protein
VVKINIKEGLLCPPHYPPGTWYIRIQLPERAYMPDRVWGCTTTTVVNFLPVRRKNGKET